MMPLLSPTASPDTRLRALYWLRWLALAGQSLTLLVVWRGLGMSLPWLPMLAVLSGLLLFNLWTGWRLRQAREVSPDLIAQQLTADILALAVLLYCSGGAFNPFVSLFLLPLTLSALMLPAGYTAGLVVLTVFLYGSLMNDSVPLPPVPPGMRDILSLHLFGMWLNFIVSACLIAVFTTYLAAQVRASQRQLAAFRERNLRQEQILALGTLAAGTAHELGTPLSTIAVIADELGRDVPEALREDVRVLQQQVTRCKAILAGMRQHAEADVMQNRQLQPWAEVVSSLVEKFRLLRPRVPLQVAPLPTAPAWLVADRTLEQALLNLLNNAADASPQHVGLDVSVHDRQLVLDISDHGSGFPAEMLAVAGEAFFSSKGEQGLGLGVFLANATLERLGGSVWFLPHAGGGALTRVRLPLVGHADDEEQSA